jgi:hypothetical protein
VFFDDIDVNLRVIGYKILTVHDGRHRSTHYRLRSIHYRVEKLLADEQNPESFRE